MCVIVLYGELSGKAKTEVATFDQPQEAPNQMYRAFPGHSYVAGSTSNGHRVPDWVERLDAGST